MQSHAPSLQAVSPPVPAPRCCSERQDKTQAAGQTLVEGSQINKSLSSLANVIYTLTGWPCNRGCWAAQQCPAQQFPQAVRGALLTSLSWPTPWA